MQAFKADMVELHSAAEERDDAQTCVRLADGQEGRGVGEAFGRRHGEPFEIHGESGPQAQCHGARDGDGASCHLGKRCCGAVSQGFGVECQPGGHHHEEDDGDDGCEGEEGEAHEAGHDILRMTRGRHGVGGMMAG